MSYLNKQIKVVGGKFASGHGKDFTNLELMGMYAGGKNIVILSEESVKWKTRIDNGFKMWNTINTNYAGSIKLIGTLIDDMITVADEIIIEDKSLLHNSKILNCKANITLILNEVY